MAQLTACDRCGTIDGTHEQATVRGARVDVCASCFDAVFQPWLDAALERLTRVPPPVQPSRANRFPRPAQHGFTAAAIEASQTPGSVVVSDGTVTDDGSEVASTP